MYTDQQVQVVQIVHQVQTLQQDLALQVDLWVQQVQLLHGFLVVLPLLEVQEHQHYQQVQGDLLDLWVHQVHLHLVVQVDHSVPEDLN